MNDHNSDKFDLLPSSGDELSGKVLSGRYKILRCIDSREKGATYQAQDLELDTAVAIIVLPAVLARNKHSIDNLLRKSKAVLKLSHPNIVRLYAFQSDGTAKYLIMEYVDGRNLEDKVFDEGTMDISGALKIFAQVAAGLDYAHSQNVLHGDIKPANIMLAKDGKAKLADFGSRCLKEAMSRATGGKISQTLFYMAPEQFSSGELDRSSDIYSLAASMYECLCGHPPFWGDSIEQQILNEEPETIEKLSDKQNAALLKALSKNPRDRQKNAKQLLTDLGADYPELKRETKPSKKFKETSDHPEDITDEKEKTEDKSKHAAVIALLAVLLALLMGLGILYIAKGKEAESKGDLDSAIDSYTKALSHKQVILTEARLDLAKKRLQAKREAERHKTEYYKWLSQAQNSEKRGNYSEAIKFYEKAQQYTDISLQTKIDSLKTQVAEQEKKSTFYKLLAYVKENDNATNGKKALGALEQALVL